jgi:hypothetical protein
MLQFSVDLCLGPPANHLNPKTLVQTYLRRAMEAPTAEASRNENSGETCRYSAISRLSAAAHTAVRRVMAFPEGK